MENSEPNPTTTLTRRLGLFDATMIIVGNVIGIGIFTTSGLVAEALRSPAALLAGWAIGGLLTLCGALTYAELGGMLPHAGGEYVYLRRAYGRFWGFLNGWTYFTVTNPGSIAAMTVGMVAYLRSFMPGIQLDGDLFRAQLLGKGIAISTGQGLSIAVILLLSTVNYVGLRAGSLVQDVLTILKLLSVSVIPLLGLLLGHGQWPQFFSSGSTPGSNISGSFSIALVSIFFSYTGWFASTYVASEIRNPERNVPYSVILGTAITTLAYLLVNLIYLYALPIERMRGVINIGEAAAGVLFGPAATKFVSLAVLISILGAANSVIMTAPRIYYAMARDGVFFRAAAKVHPRFKTPTGSIFIQAVWCCLLVLSGTFSQLLTYTVVPMLAFSVTTGIAVFVLRRSEPRLHRPYRTQGYPWVPAVFVMTYVVALVYVTVSSPRASLVGLAIVAMGIPLYLFWNRSSTPPSNENVDVLAGTREQI